MESFRLKLYDVFHNPHTRSFIVVNDFLAFLTIASVLALVLETVQSLAPYQILFTVVEYTAVFFFTLEYVGRIFVAQRKSLYLVSFFGVVDLLAILPSYLLLANLTFLKTVRVLRVLRFLRMIRLAKLIELGKGRVRDIEEHARIYRLNLQIYFFTLFSAVIIFGTLLYLVEGEQAGAANIPLAMIWIAKVISGGVAQFMPETVWGDLVIIAARFTGLLLFGLLIYIVGDTVKRLLFGSTEIRG